MASAQAVLVFEIEKPIPFTVADSAAIEKGDFLKLSDPATVALTSADNDLFGGIAAEEKIANDGKTKIPVYRKGFFRVESNGTTTVGLHQVIKAKNELADMTTLDDENGKVFGTSLETATDGEFFLFDLGAR